MTAPTQATRLLVLSANSISSYRMCPYYYFASYVCRRVSTEPITSPTRLQFGSAFHKGLEVWRSSGDLACAVASALQELGTVPLTENVCTSAKLKDLLTIYTEYYADDLQRYTVLMSELPFQFALDDNVAWKGRVDAVLKDRQTGRIYILDTKTSARPANFKAYPNVQISGYDWAGHQMYGSEFSGVILDLVLVQKTKPQRAKNGIDRWLQGAGPADVFFRYQSACTPYQLTEWRQDVLDTARDVQHRIETGNWPRWANCSMYGGSCQYLDVCRLPPEARMDALYSDAFTTKPNDD